MHGLCADPIDSDISSTHGDGANYYYGDPTANGINYNFWPSKHVQLCGYSTTNASFRNDCGDFTTDCRTW